MSVLVWDGKTLATDRAANDGINRWLVQKIWFRSGNIVAAIGSSSVVSRFLSWYDDQTNLKFPSYSGNALNAVVVGEHGLSRYLPGGEQQDHGHNILALGEGRDFAYGALALGHTAIEAVRAANMYSLTCGLGIAAYSVETQKLSFYT